jgi:uncharacterized protein
MKIAVAGGTGFLGRPLCDRLVADRHEVLVLSRRSTAAGGHTGRAHAATDRAVATVAWVPDGTAGRWASALEGVDAVVNLAGESIGDHRWSARQKQRILDSRLSATGSLVAAIASLSQPPSVFISASAVGYYGSRGDERLTEASQPGSDFLAGVCVEWERAARRASSAGTRVVLVRSGLILERNGGALARMLMPFRLFAGGPFGSGRQYTAWIHRADWVDLVRWAIATRSVEGPLNATAPNPVTNREFSQALGRILHRPSWLPVPAVALKLALGEMGEALLLSGQRAVPEQALKLGFSFRYPDLDPALQAILA